jgi:hypothetical protein
LGNVERVYARTAPVHPVSGRVLDIVSQGVKTGRLWFHQHQPKPRYIALTSALGKRLVNYTEAILANFKKTGFPLRQFCCTRGRRNACREEQPDDAMPSHGSFQPPKITCMVSS